MGVAIPQIVTEDRAGGGQVIEGSLKFDSSKSHYLTRTPSSAGNRKTWTWSGWVKRSALSTYQYIWGNANVSAENGFMLRFDNNDVIRIADWTNTAVWQKITTQVFRDVSAWYHIVISYDTTNATASDRVRFYINGSRVTSFSTNTDPTQNYDGYTNNTSADSIGRWGLQADYYLNANISNVYLIDGQALDASYFGYTDPLTNTWRPKKFKPQATPNNGTVWSNDLTSNVGFYAGEGAIYAFDGDNTTYASVATGGASNYINFSCNIPIVSTLRVKVSTSTNYVYINGSGTPAVSGTGYLTVPSPPANLTQLRVYGDTGVGARIYAIEVDGIELLDGDTSNMGANAFYLPFDGNSPIGQDQSGRGNNWTPVNFGGSNTLEKSTGALPILNTDGGGKVARVGVRTDSAVGAAVTCVLALPLVGIKSDFSNSVDSRSSNKAVTENGGISGSSIQSNFYGRSYLFDGSNDYLTVGTNTDWTFLHNGSSYTVECWVYATSTYGYLGRGYIFFNTQGSIAGAETGFALWCNSSSIKVSAPNGNPGSTQVNLSYNYVLPANKWTHLAVTFDGSTCNLFIDGVISATDTASSFSASTSTNTLNIGRTTDSYYFNDGYLQDVRIYQGVKYTQNFIPASTDPDILPDTPSGVAYGSNVTPIPSTDGGSIALNGTGDYLKTVGASSDFAMGTGNFTIEMFIYPQTVAVYSPGILSWSSTEGTTADYTNAGFIAYGADRSITVLLGTNSSYASISTPAVLKFDSWNHIAIVRDTGNTFRVFVNGELAVTDTSTLASTNITAQYMTFGAYYTNNNYMVRGFISNVHVVKGTALYSSNFTPPVVGIASTTNTKLLFAKSGISTTATEVTPSGVTIGIAGTARVTNFNPFTSNINTQRGQESGYCTLNPLTSPGTNYITLSNGNLDQVALTETVSSTKGTVGVTTGKWYWECNLKLLSSGGVSPRIGICRQSAPSLSQANGADEWIIYMTDYAGYGGRGAHNSTLVGSDAPFANGDVGMFALDMNSSKIYFGKNGIWLNGGNPVNGSGAFFTDVTGEIFPLTNTGYYSSVSMNFGQKPFKFPPPTGFQPLALANTPRPTIVRPDQYVGVTTYKGNNSSKVVSNLPFKPDFVWIKNRTGGSSDHGLFDSVRGAGYALRSSTTGEETIPSPNDGFISFDKNGFTMGANNNSGCPDINYINNNDYVAWAWKAGGNSNTFNINDIGYSTASAAGLTVGSITPTGASVNTKSGFSIIGYTGTGANATISHGLGNVPSFIIIKKRTSSPGATNWRVYHSALGNTKAIFLSTTGASDTNSVYWNNTSPTSSVFSLGSDDGLNASSQTHIAYLWAEIPGFSKFGSYTGNGSADGPVIITGFRPRWVMVKGSTFTSNWNILDAARDPYNLQSNRLRPNLSSAEGSDTSGTYAICWDALSNGFKLRGGSSTNDVNQTNETFIYAAFAEAPSFNLYGGQANAR